MAVPVRTVLGNQADPAAPLVFVLSGTEVNLAKVSEDYAVLKRGQKVNIAEGCLHIGSNTVGKVSTL